VHLLLGLAFGVVLVKSEVLSWFRIQEMFRFQAFHMYGIIGSAIVVGFLGRRLLGHPPIPERPRPNHIVGGVIFGLGWGLTGACPGPMYALLGYGVTPYALVIAGALLGTLTYGRLRQTRLANHPLFARAFSLR
jgi:hypothetical protein